MGWKGQGSVTVTLFIEVRVLEVSIDAFGQQRNLSVAVKLVGWSFAVLGLPCASTNHRMGETFLVGWAFVVVEVQKMSKNSVFGIFYRI
mgnify:CR=1 FL=1